MKSSDPHNSTKIIDDQRNVEGKIYNVLETVPADDIASSGAKISVGTEMTKSESRVYSGQLLRG